jgi:hypothetical protein
MRPQLHGTAKFSKSADIKGPTTMQGALSRPAEQQQNPSPAFSQEKRAAELEARAATNNSLQRERAMMSANQRERIGGLSSQLAA